MLSTFHQEAKYKGISVLFRKHHVCATAGERSWLQKVITPCQFFVASSFLGVKLEKKENFHSPKDFCQNKQPYD